MANLLTMEAKKGLVHKQQLRRLVVIFFLMDLLFLVAVVFSLTIWLSLRIQKQVPILTQVNNSSLIGGEEERLVDNKVAQLSKWWTSHDWSTIFERIKISQSKGIKINQFAGLLSAKDGAASLVVSGQATNRQDLVKFVDDLKQERFFNKVDLPIEYLLSTSRGQFTLNLEVKND